MLHLWRPGAEGLAAQRRPERCPPGRFIVTISGLTSGGNAPGAVVIEADGTLTVLGTCRPTKARVRATRTSTTWIARWRRGCEALGAGRVKLKLTVMAPACDTMRAAVVTRKPRATATFTGIREPQPTTTTTIAVTTTTAGVPLSTTTSLPVTTTTIPPAPSVARLWNEELLEAIRQDTPRPTVHARNLFHVSAAMYDAWAAYDATATPYIVAERPVSGDPEHDREIAISYAAYRVLAARFAHSPGATRSLAAFDARMLALGLDPSTVGVDDDLPAAVGNRIGAAVLAYGLADGSNEASGYADPTYAPVNESLIVKQPGTVMVDPNRWQPLALDRIVTQNGIILPDKVQTFIGSHWGQVTPFALVRSDPDAVYVDPGVPPQLGEALFTESVVQVIRLSSWLDPDDGATIDISPGATGNNPLGTNDGTGRALNPVTGQPYEPNVVKRGDFGRVLAEYWADGPRSETPPGHWNVIANDVSDHLGRPLRIAGSGPELHRLEWDVKLYFALNGALHDAAIACWRVKRKYDYVRPISMVRYMGGRGQSSDPGLPSYHAEGLPLVSGLIELVTAESAAPGERHEELAGHEGKIAIRSWPGQPPDPVTQVQGARWILAVNWVPYQKDTFVTPAFAAYTSGHSTYSRSGAEVLTRFTASAFFPGGLGEFTAERDAYLTFERGPSETVTMQTATYYDAADQAGQSRLWSGIHVASDDFGGRRMGAQIGPAAYALALEYFSGVRTR